MDVHCSLELKKKIFIQPGIKIIIFFSHRASPFSHSHLFEALSQNSFPKLTLLTSLSQGHSLNITLSSSLFHCRRSLTSPTHQSSQAADQTHFSSTDQTHADTVLLTKAQLCNWWFFILFVIDDFVWSRLRRKIRDLGWCSFFFLLWTSGGDGCGCDWW